jgi:starch synthase
MASGLPSIATRIGGCLDVMTEQSGLLVPSDDVSALAAAIDTVVADAGRRAELAAAGRQRVLDRFAFSITAAQLQQIYRQAVASNRGVKR